MSKITGTILLDRRDHYVDDEGNLPERPVGDKEWLSALVKGAIISIEAGEMLPPSIRGLAVAITCRVEPTCPITIPEIDALSDILIVVRSSDVTIMSGKVFKFHNFNLILTSKEIEIWCRK